MPKPALIHKREQEPAEPQEQEEFVVVATGESVPTTTPPPTTAATLRRVLQPADVQAKYEALLELILSLSDEQIRTFFTPDGVKYILEQFAQRGDPIAKLAKAHCTK